jgi:hypothetical protein
VLTTCPPRAKCAKTLRGRPSYSRPTRGPSSPQAARSLWSAMRRIRLWSRSHRAVSNASLQVIWRPLRISYGHPLARERSPAAVRFCERLTLRGASRDYADLHAIVPRLKRALVELYAMPSPTLVAICRTNANFFNAGRFSRPTSRAFPDRPILIVILTATVCFLGATQRLPAH